MKIYQLSLISTLLLIACESNKSSDPTPKSEVFKLLTSSVWKQYEAYHVDSSFSLQYESEDSLKITYLFQENGKVKIKAVKPIKFDSEVDWLLVNNNKTIRMTSKTQYSSSSEDYEIEKITQDTLWFYTIVKSGLYPGKISYRSTH